MTVNIPGVLPPFCKGRGGVRTEHHKDMAKQAVERMPAPDEVVLPLSMHIGAPCAPTVAVGDSVKIGQIIGDTDKFVSAPIHASVSGTVKAIGPVKVANGSTVNAVTIASDGKMELFEEIAPPVVTDRASFLAAVRASGLVGLGGAGFPAHVKLAFKEDAGVDTLIINGAECEPYITVDHREMLDRPEEILAGAAAVKKQLGFRRAVVAVEENKPDALASFQAVIQAEPEAYGDIELMRLPSSYPQGAEKVLIQSVTGRRVPPGKLPADVGCVVMNVQSASFLARYLRTGKPLVSRSLTIAGDAVATPKNLRVPIGSMLDGILDYCGGFSKTPYKVLSGGPMMGIALADLHVPAVKSGNALLAFSAEALPEKPFGACIRCGRCAEACPLHLEPCRIEKQVKLKSVEGLQKTNVLVCMECGCCAYSCPAGRPLVQSMRLGKAIVMEAMKR